jgi:site-specific DNA-methyltransferase (adenine-specific)
MGSGTTGIGCVNTKRKFLGIELNDLYFKLATHRITAAATTAAAATADADAATAAAADADADAADEEP